MKFVYVFSSWDGTVSDSTMFHNVFFFWSDYLARSAPKAARSHFGYKSNFFCGRGKASNLPVCYMSSSGEISYSNAFVLASVGLGHKAVALRILGSCPSLSHVHTH